MKFEIRQEEFQKALDIVVNAILPKSPMPVLSSILVEAGDFGLRLTGSSLDVSIVTTLAEVDVKAPGRVAVPAGKFVPFVRSLSPGTVTVAHKAKQIRLDCGKARLTENTMDANAYPELKIPEVKDGLPIDAQRLVDMVNDTAYAVSRDEGRAVLTGILCEIRPDSLTMVTTDAHRLARSVCSTAWPTAASRDVVANTGGLRQLPRIVAAMPAAQDQPATATVFLQGSQISFCAGNTTLHSRLLEGAFPDYKAVIPADNDKRVVVDRSEFSRAIRRVSITADRVTSQVKLAVEKGRMELSARGSDGSLAEDEIPVAYAGDPIEIGFNYGYLQDILKNIRTDSIEISLRDPQSAALVRPITEGGEDTGVLCLLMPLRLAGD